MPVTLADATGDGQTSDLVDCAIVLPDTGSNVQVSGRVQKVGQSSQTVPRTTLQAPPVPGSGSTYWVIQVDYTNGTPTLKQSSSAYPVADPNNLIVFSQQLNSGVAPDEANIGGATPDDW